jgi:hypothetical protein
MQTLQNLSVLGLPITLTEFGVKDNASQQLAALILDETMRLVFGTANADGFYMWGFWRGDIWRGAASFFDQNWSLTLPGQAWMDLMDEWDTELTAVVAPDGTISFDGFWGDYEITVNGMSYDLTLQKGVSDYQLVLAVPGDADGDGDVDLDDFNELSANMYSDVAGGFDDGDFDSDGDVDFDDWVIQALNFGKWPDAEEALGQLPGVPEPAFAGLVILMSVLIRRR